MGRVELVTGGARSGKSAFAEGRALELGAACGPGSRVVYVATAVPFDQEMAERIARHRGRRPASWESLEAPLELGAAIAGAAGRADVVIVDCLSVWAANRLLELGELPAADPPADLGADLPADLGAGPWWASVASLEEVLVAELDEALGATRSAATHVVVVTNEVGSGVVPPTPLGRAYRDLLGRLNQRVASGADAVHLVVSGIAVDLRRLAGSKEPNVGG